MTEYNPETDNLTPEEVASFREGLSGWSTWLPFPVNDADGNVYGVRSCLVLDLGGYPSARLILTFVRGKVMYYAPGLLVADHLGEVEGEVEAPDTYVGVDFGKIKEDLLEAIVGEAIRYATLWESGGREIRQRANLLRERLEKHCDQ